jgi:hypothetical protein
MKNIFRMEPIRASVTLHYALKTSVLTPTQREARMLSRDFGLFTPCIYDYGGQTAVFGPGQKAIAYLCNRTSTDHIAHPDECQMVHAQDEEYMCLVVTNTSPNIFVQVDPFSTLPQLMTTPMVTIEYWALSKEDIFVSS